MLDSIRKRRNNFILKGIIILTAAVMLFFGLGKTAPEGKGGNTVVAWVNGEPISRIEFARAYENRLYQYQAMFGGNYDEKLLAALQIPQRTLEELIQQKLLAQEALKFQIHVPNVELADHIRNLPYYQKDGKFDRDSYDKLPNRGLEEARQREQLRVGKFYRLIADRVRLTPTALKNAYLMRDTKVDVDYAKINLDTLAGQQKQTAAQVDQFLKTVSSDELKRYYDSHVKDFSEPAQVELSQIRIGVPFQASAAKKNEAKAKIEALAKTVTPENFAEIAKSKSDDEHAKKGGLVGWVKRGSSENAVEDALDRLEVGKVSPPVETTYGYYLLKISKKKEQVTKSLDQVKRQVAEKLSVESQKKRWVEQKKAQLEKTLAAGKPLDSELKALKIDVKKTGPFSLANGYLPNIGQSEALLDALAQLTPESPIAKKLISHQDDLYYLKLRKVDFAKTAELPKQQEAVEKATSTSLQGELVSQWVQNLEKTASIKRELVFKNEAAEGAE